ncbi:MAG: hypothetical protein ACI83W_001635 [Marinoscillum sp.]|jgi:hypothetical protein
MKLFGSLSLLLVMIGCKDPIMTQGLSKASEYDRTKVIYFPCNKYNGSTDWVYCTPVTVDLSLYPELERATMTYLMATTRASSDMIVELYNVDDQVSIPLSVVISDPSLAVERKQSSGDILVHLPLESKTLVVRFRNSEDGPEGYINNYSHMTLTYK